MFKTPNIHRQTPNATNTVTRKSTGEAKDFREDPHQKEIQPRILEQREDKPHSTISREGYDTATFAGNLLEG